MKFDMLNRFNKLPLLAAAFGLTIAVNATVSSGAAQAMRNNDTFKSPPNDTASVDSAGYLNRTAMLPLRVMGFGAALAIGTPIAVVRSEAKSFGEYSRAVDAQMSAKDGSLGLVLVSLPGEAVQIVEKAGTGAIEGGFNAMEGWDRPFSEKSFSLN